MLSIETYVREDQIKLFGFRGDIEREWFRLLQTVQGVGAKVALAVLSTLPPAELANAIALRDKAAVTRTPGVGPKVAERIVTELKDKAPAFANVDPALVHLSGAIDNDRAPRPVTDAISALVNLGYGQPQAAAAIASRLAQRRRERGDRAADPAGAEGTGEVSVATAISLAARIATVVAGSARRQAPLPIRGGATQMAMRGHGLTTSAWS